MTVSINLTLTKEEAEQLMRAAVKGISGELAMKIIMAINESIKEE